MRTCLLLLLLATPAFADEFADLRSRFAQEKGKTYNERIETVRKIEAVGTPAALRFLVRVVEEDADRSMQLNTVYSIARMPLRAAFDALLDFYREDEGMRSTIFSAITSYRKEPLPADLLEEALAGKDQGMRSNVIRYFQRRGDKRFLPEAERFLRDFPNGGPSLVSTLTNDMSVDSARLLVMIYDDGRQYDRQQIPKKFAEADEKVRAVLGEAILAGKEPAATNAATIAARAGVAEAEAAIVEAFKRAKPAAKAPLLEAVGAVGGKTEEGRAAILEALSAKDPDLVVAAVRAVRAAPSKEAIPRLIEILALDDRILKGEARVTLERIVGQQYGERVDLWKAWWEEYGPAFTLEGREPPDPDALDQPLVDLAIEKGALALKAIRAEDDPPWEYASHPVGTTSLVVLALHAAGVGPKDRDLKAGLKYLLSASVPDKTYDLGILSVALETVGGKKYRRRIAECARRLLSTQLDHGMWGYPTGDGDNSNTQYAVLGLRSAVRAGVKIPDRTWRKVHDHYTGTRGPDGGWSYTLSHRAVSSASMTAAGVSCLLICLENMKLGDAERTALRAEIDRGFDALGEKMKLDKDSLYALYGMERAGVLGSKALFGGKPWYVPGAKRLIGEQGRDGLWRGQYKEAVDTSFAILFLKKATAPISSR